MYLKGYCEYIQLEINLLKYLLHFLLLVLIKCVEINLKVLWQEFVNLI